MSAALILHDVYLVNKAPQLTQLNGSKLEQIQSNFKAQGVCNKVLIMASTKEIVTVPLRFE